MHIAVIGGTGLIGSRVVRDLDAAGHRAVPHSQSTGVDVVTDDGLDAALAGADVVVNLTNSPTFDDASPAFFRTSMDNLVAAARKADVGHFVVLSIVGVDQVPELDYYRAKTLQEDILKVGPVPYSIVRATQFMEFIDAVLSWTADDETVRLPRTRLQPVAAEDVAATVAGIASGEPLRGTVDLAGPAWRCRPTVPAAPLATARGSAGTVTAALPVDGRHDSGPALPRGSSRRRPGGRIRRGPAAPWELSGCCAVRTRTKDTGQIHGPDGLAGLPVDQIGA
ncbi:SDR family oxidoreductase [Streptomyces cyaneofuscatus]